MNTIDNSGPAFPYEHRPWFGDGTVNRSLGMSLRDYFAAHAPTGEEGIATPALSQMEEFLGIEKGTYNWLVHWPMVVAKARYVYADAMLAARGK